MGDYEIGDLHGPLCVFGSKSMVCPYWYPSLMLSMTALLIVISWPLASTNWRKRSTTFEHMEPGLVLPLANLRDLSFLVGVLGDLREGERHAVLELLRREERELGAVGVVGGKAQEGAVGQKFACEGRGRESPRVEVEVPALYHREVAGAAHALEGVVLAPAPIHHQQHVALVGLLEGAEAPRAHAVPLVRAQVVRAADYVVDGRLGAHEVEHHAYHALLRVQVLAEPDLDDLDVVLEYDGNESLQA